MKACILLSTYNGEKFLAQQLDSILAQRDVEILLLVRDDGSTDGTRVILRDYASHHPNIRLRLEDNLGFAGSFDALLRWGHAECANQVEYFAFADQDDYWMPEKVSVAVEAIQGKGGVWLYMSNATIADSKLTPVCPLFDKPIEKMTFAQALIDAYTYGCTMCMNRALLDAYVRMTQRVPVVHDRWCYLLSMLLGHVVYDPMSHLLYRQHGNNAGGVKCKTTDIIGRIRLMRKVGRLISDTDLQLYESIVRAGSVPPQSLEMVVAYRRSFWGRIRLLLKWNELGFNRRCFGDDFKKRIKILMGVV